MDQTIPPTNDLIGVVARSNMSTEEFYFVCVRMRLADTLQKELEQTQADLKRAQAEKNALAIRLKDEEMWADFYRKGRDAADFRVEKAEDKLKSIHAIIEPTTATKPASVPSNEQTWASLAAVAFPPKCKHGVYADSGRQCYVCFISGGK